MMRAKYAILVITLSICLCFLPLVAAYAIDVLPTPDEYWLRDTTLKIAAYRRTSLGDSVRYIEVFNDSDDQLVNIQDWVITGVFSDTKTSSKVQLSINTASLGQLAPKHHAVIQVTDQVGGATFSGSWAVQPPAKTTLTGLEVGAVTTGYRLDSYALKASTDSVTKMTIYDDFWVRSQISGESYSSTLSSYSVTLPIELHDDGLYQAPISFPGRIVEIYPYNSDCAPDDTSVLCGDYVKLKLDNPLADISRYVLRTDSSSSSRTTSNTFYLGNPVYAASNDGYVTITQDEEGKRLSLTNSGGYVWIEDLYGAVPPYAATMTRYEAAGSSEHGYSWALGETDIWQWSTTPAPGLGNKITPPIEEITTCPTGKYLSPDTGRCRTIEEAVNALAACPEGQERNPTTNRCRAKVTIAVASVTPCAEGQERNPATNRCRSIVSTLAELVPCDEGEERNPATNRCRKVAGVSTASLTNSQKIIEPAKDGNMNAWTWSIIAVVTIGVVVYGLYEWRHELAGFGRTIASKLGKK